MPEMMAEGFEPRHPRRDRRFDDMAANPGRWFHFTAAEVTSRAHGVEEFRSIMSSGARHRNLRCSAIKDRDEEGAMFVKFIGDPAPELNFD